MSSVARGTKRLSSALAANGPEALASERPDAPRISDVLTHDLNNLLGVILGATERLAAELSDGGEQQKLALLALEAARAHAPELGAVDCAATLETRERLARARRSRVSSVSVQSTAASSGA